MPSITSISGNSAHLVIISHNKKHNKNPPKPSMEAWNSLNFYFKRAEVEKNDCCFTYTPYK